MPFEGEDSASKRACRTAESLVVRFGFVEEIVVEAIFVCLCGSIELGVFDLCDLRYRCGGDRLGLVVSRCK